MLFPLIRAFPNNPGISFMRGNAAGVGLALMLVLGSIGLFFSHGLNLGLDFKGGVLIELRTAQPADIPALRSTVNALNLGEVSIQRFGADDEVLIRVQAQDNGDEPAQMAAITRIKEALPADVEYRRVEFVGPTVGADLQEKGIIAVSLALVAILLYIWFRFEWHYGVGAVLALIHDVVVTIGLFALLQIDFNLSTVAAILTIAGYSINDTVVVFDRIRENLRKYKKPSLSEIIDISLNETLSRTILTSGTTLIALFALYFLGGEVIAGFTLAMIWGISIGTFSSVYVATPALLLTGLKRELVIEN